MAFARHQVARAAGERSAVALLHNRRCGRVLVGKPVGWTGQVVDLRRRVLLRAARHALGCRRLRRQRAVDRRKRPRRIVRRRRRLLLLQLLLLRTDGQYRTDSDDERPGGMLHESPPETRRAGLRASTRPLISGARSRPGQGTSRLNTEAAKDAKKKTFLSAAFAAFAFQGCISHQSDT